MNLKKVHILKKDRVGMGRDGPLEQPIENTWGLGQQLGSERRVLVLPEDRIANRRMEGLEVGQHRPEPAGGDAADLAENVGYEPEASARMIA
jgi:hypothetical protein